MQNAVRNQQGIRAGRIRRRLGILAVIAILTASGLWWIAGRDPQADGYLAAWGRFHDVAHRGSGIGAIYVWPARQELHLLYFETAETPGLEVLLITAPDAFDNDRVRASGSISLGPLQGPGSAHVYRIPETVNIHDYRAVTIWLPEHQVNFTTAPLRPPEAPPFWRGLSAPSGPRGNR